MCSEKGMAEWGETAVRCLGVVQRRVMVGEKRRWISPFRAGECGGRVGSNRGKKEVEIRAWTPELSVGNG